MLVNYRKTVIDAMAPAWDPSTKHGIFSDACQVHVESSVSWSKVKIQGTLLRDSVARWYFNHTTEKLLDAAFLLLNASVVNGTEQATGFYSTNPTCKL